MLPSRTPRFLTTRVGGALAHLRMPASMAAVEIDKERTVPSAPAHFGGIIASTTTSKTLGVESIHDLARRLPEGDMNGTFRGGAPRLPKRRASRADHEEGVL